MSGSPPGVQDSVDHASGPPPGRLSRELELKLTSSEQVSEDEIVGFIRERAEVSGPAVVRHSDRYYDTEARALASAGLAARCRTEPPARTVQVKPVLILRDAVMDRLELSVVVEDRDEAGAAIRALIESTWPIHLDGDPVELVRIETRRTRHDVVGAGFEAELCFDQVRCEDGSGQSVGFHEIELELVSGDELAFRDLARDLTARFDLEPSTDPKFVRVLALLGLPGYRYKIERPAFGPGDPMGAVARTVFRWLLETIRAYEPGTRVGADPEQLHKMRVATRRLRAALRIFQKALRKADRKRLSAGFKWLGGVLGDVRDLDVLQLARPEWRETRRGPAAGWERLGDALVVRWNTVRAHLIDALGSARYDALMDDADEVFSADPGFPPDHRAHRPVAETARTELRKWARRLREALARCLETHDADDFHEARVAGKRLRYAIQFFEPLLDASLIKRARRFKRFQDALGQIQDAAQAGLLMDELKDTAVGDAPADDDYLLVLGLLADDARATVESAPATVDRAIRDLGGLESARWIEDHIDE